MSSSKTASEVIEGLELALSQASTKEEYIDIAFTVKDEVKAFNDIVNVGKEFCDLYTLCIDEIIKNLYANVLECIGEKQSYPAVLVGLGGYGRREMCPASDIDLMLLYAHRIEGKELKTLLEVFEKEVVTMLWDMGFKVGSVVRTVNDVLEEAKKDFRTFNSQLESRYICGSVKMHDLFSKTYKSFIAGYSSPQMLESYIHERDYWHDKYGDTVFLQEPDVKNGVGGLRDYHTIIWASRAYYNTADPGILVKKAVLSRSELEELEQAYNFLLKVRIELHFTRGRPTNILNIEKQALLAEALGYHGENPFETIELFMKDYYQSADSIHQITNLMYDRLQMRGTVHRLGLFWLKSFLEQNKPGPRKRIDGFVLREGKFIHSDNKVFKEDPVRMIRLFRHCQQYHATLHPSLKALVRNSVHLITHEVIEDESANKSFRAILQAIGEVYPTLQLMNELGVLGAFIPEFGQLRYLVQHDYYHRYTADAHTLSAIKFLDDIFSNADTTARRYEQSVRKTTRPSLLYLMLLLHDIGKAQGSRGHCRAGVKMAKPVLERLGVTPRQQQLVLFTIEHHLEMARFWQRFDVEDPQVIEAFANFLGDVDLLYYLFVETYCDSRATGATLWNSYKDMLHNRLFEQTLEVFDRKEPVSPLARLADKKALFEGIFKVHHQDYSDQKIREVSSLYPNRYFTTSSIEEMRTHVKMLDQLEAHIAKSDCSGSLMPIINWQEDISQTMTIVTLVTWDRSGLFASLAGAFSATGYNILSTKAFTRKDRITIDTFYVIESEMVTDPSDVLKKVFLKNLHNIFVEDADPLPAIITQARRQMQRQPLETSGSIQSVHSIAPCLNVYHDITMGKTIVEVQCEDRIGLLYQVTKSITDHGFDIMFARITTEHGVANDVFHIQKNNIDEAIGAHDLIDLREDLNAVLQIPLVDMAKR